jgi:hypothetical protein
MKNFNFKHALIALGLVFTVVTTSSCSDDNTDNGGPTPPTNNTLTGLLSEDYVLTQGDSYALDGEFRVQAGATLSIQPGVTITAKSGGNTDYILIEKGARINAQGTANAPIVLTSDLKEPGAWAGLHICGNAKINLEGGTGKSEVGNAAYGGTDDTDSSGTLKYVRVEYAGEKLNAEGTKEGNGVTFYGVGNGTTVDYVQAYKGTDDGFEFFGGTVNVKHLVATNNSDDSFDWTQGWRGKAQFLVAYQDDPTTLGYECDALMECDNLENNHLNQPISHPTIANITLVGNGSTKEKRGIRLRAGTQISLYNALVTNKVKCLTTQTTETEAALNNGTSILEYIYLENTVTSETGGYDVNTFTSATGNAINQTIALSNAFVGTIAGGKDMSAVDVFFDTANYKGAVETVNNWTSGWTR